MRTIAHWILAASVAGAALQVAGPAAAYEVDTCWGWDVTWDNDQTARLLPISFPSGSVWRDDLMVAFDRWNDMRGMSFEFENIVDDNNNTFNYSNDRNELAWNSSETGGALAVTVISYDLCFFGQDIEEADIVFNNAITWETGAHDPRTEETTASFRFTAVHEMGHFLGLLHENDEMATMLSTASGFHGGNGNFRAAPFPDDAQGARRLYPHSNSETDFSVSNFRWVASNDTELILGSATQTVNPGDTFNSGFGFGNQGKTHVNFPISVVLSTNTTITTFDRIIATGSAWADPYFYGDFTFQFAVPGDMAPGDYYAGVILDPSNDVSENRELNNAVAFPGLIRVVSP